MDSKRIGGQESRLDGGKQAGREVEWLVADREAGTGSQAGRQSAPASPPRSRCRPVPRLR